MNLLKGIGYCIPLKLYCDNFNAISMAKNPIFHHRTKYIKIDVHFVRERIASSVLSLAHISGPNHMVDIFTKLLYAPKFVPNLSKLFIGPIPPWAWGGGEEISFQSNLVCHVTNANKQIRKWSILWHLQRLMNRFENKISHMSRRKQIWNWRDMLL